MKVKIIDEPYYSRTKEVPRLEDLINKFIKDKHVIDIKYQSNISGFASQGIDGSDSERSVLIMYED